MECQIGQLVLWDEVLNYISRTVQLSVKVLYGGTASLGDSMQPCLCPLETSEHHEPSKRDRSSRYCF